MSTRNNRLLTITAVAAQVLAGCMLLMPSATAQIQSTISCPAGYGYWDTLSIMMLDPGLVSKGYHMEGYTDYPSGSDAYIYTTWTSSENKVWYVKNPQGWPWDINLYDSQPDIPEQGYVYQWVTELNWSTDSECKKFNDGSDSSTADYSFRWAARCAVPGGANGSMWNSPPPAQPYNTNYYTIDSGTITKTQNLGYALLELKPTSTITIYDTRSDPPTEDNATTMPLQYTYSCYEENVNACEYREVFTYAADTVNPNPYDGVYHSYGWVEWQLYNNTAYVDNAQNPAPANWVLSTDPPTSLQNYLVAGTTTTQFDCF